jgi:protein-serine/threonine kinase
MGAILGQGTQGKVVVGERIEDGLAVAIKIVDERTIKPWSYVNKIPVSVHLLSNLNSAESEDEDPLFLRYIDHFYIEKHWVIITEYQGKEWMDLHDYLNSSSKSLSEQECLLIFTEIVQALSHLYAMGFTHNDIKENNVLIHRKTKEIKLIDLCSCRELSDELISPIEFKGTMWYASPEVKTCNFFSAEKQDIYALGILLLMMIFKDSFPVDLQKDVLDPHELPKAFKSLEFSSTTIRLIQSMVQRKAHKRPNIIDVLDLMSTWKQVE